MWRCIGIRTQRLFQGEELVKFGRKGDPHASAVKLSADCELLTWSSKKNKEGGSSLRLRRVEKVTAGQAGSPVFARFKGSSKWGTADHAARSLWLRYTEAPPAAAAGAGGGAGAAAAGSGERTLRTLDLLCASAEQAERWTKGLTAALAALRQAKPV